MTFDDEPAEKRPDADRAAALRELVEAVRAFTAPHIRLFTQMIQIGAIQGQAIVEQFLARGQAAAPDGSAEAQGWTGRAVVDVVDGIGVRVG